MNSHRKKLSTIDAHRGIFLIIYSDSRSCLQIKHSYDVGDVQMLDLLGN